MLIRVPVRSRSSPKITLTCKTERKCHCVNWTQATKMKPRSLEKIATEKMLYSVRHVCLIPRGVLADSRATGFWFRARYHGKEDTLPSVLCVHAKCSHGPSPDTPWYLVQSRFLFSTLETPRNEADATRSPLKGNEPMAQAQNAIKGLGSHHASRASFCLLLDWGGERRLYLNRLKPLRSLQPQLLDWSILFYLVKLVFRVRASVSWKTAGHKRLAVSRERLLGLSSKLYPSNMQRMLKKDLTPFMQSLSRSRPVPF